MDTSQKQVPPPGQEVKKKKKKDPLRPQPAWLFPPDEENPVLNPKVKSPEQIEKETADRLRAIEYLNYRSVSAPMKSAPPGELMQLIGAFLTSYGFNSTSRVFTVERDARRKIDDYKDEIGKKFDKGMPSLVQIYQAWQHEWELKRAQDKADGVDETSSEDEVAGEESESEPEVKNKGKKAKGKGKKGKGKGKGSDPDSDSDSDLDSDSDSDSDSEDEKAKKPAPKAAKSSKTSQPANPARSTEPAPVQTKGVKRKNDGTDSDSDSASDSDADSDDSEAPAKKQKVTASKSKPSKSGEKAEKSKAGQSGKKAAASSYDSDSSDSDSRSGSDSDSESPAEPTPSTKKNLTNGVKDRGDSKTSTDSSHTLNGNSIQTPAKKAAKQSTKKAAQSPSDSDDSSDSSESSDSSSSDQSSENQLVKEKGKKGKSTAETPTVPKRKRSKSPSSAQATPSSAAAAKVAKKNNVPFSRIPKDTAIDPRLASNAYVPYDYAQRAHEDLIVTRGKGFTKEKNKKKRGSYRGGLIDVAGGKGIKFDD